MVGRIGNEGSGALGTKSGCRLNGFGLYIYYHI